MFDDTATRVLVAVMAQHRPTVRSVAAEIGRSLGKTHDELVRLRAAGLVTWDRGRTGTLRSTCGFVPTTERPFDTLEAPPTTSEAGDALVTHPGLVGGPNPIKEGHRA